MDSLPLFPSTAPPHGTWKVSLTPEEWSSLGNPNQIKVSIDSATSPDEEVLTAPGGCMIPVSQGEDS
jgi:hypothetical protein